MDAPILFSIIVPVYNAGSYLKMCIESVLQQDTASWELILVDDGSKDHSGEICDRYALQNAGIRVLHQKNQGHTAARNAGLDRARGRYVLFLDSDDWLEADTLSCCETCITGKQPDMILFGYQEDTNGKAKACVPQFPAGYYDKNRIQAEILPQLLMNADGAFFPRALWGKVFRKELLCRHQQRIPRDILTGEDMCCVICTVLETGSMEIMQQCFYHYRILPASISRRGDAKAFDRSSSLLHFLEREIPRNDMILREQFYRLAVQQMYSAAVRAAGAGKVGKTEQAMFRTYLSQPVCREAVRQAVFSKKAGHLRVKHTMLRIGSLKAISMLQHVKSGESV
ncbi:MAG: glycosyltransferase [Clostridia bacterium]|nr:glycosyltransferase [Clostridia bacterium]